jgi:hypothetical protein
VVEVHGAREGIGLGVALEDDDAVAAAAEEGGEAAPDRSAPHDGDVDDHAPSLIERSGICQEV